MIDVVRSLVLSHLEFCTVIWSDVDEKHLKKKGAWPNWEHVTAHKIIWTVLWKSTPAQGSQWSPCNSIRLAVESWPSETVEVPITITTLRSALVLRSEATKQVVLLELTVPWGDWIVEAHEQKRAKYHQLVVKCQRQGWKACCGPIKVDCRDFVGQSLRRTLKFMGYQGCTGEEPQGSSLKLLKILHGGFWSRDVICGAACYL